MSGPNQDRIPILDPAGIEDHLRRIARDILEKHPAGPLALVGIHRRGVVVAQRLLDMLREQRQDIAFGTIDISLYRDDLDNLGTIPFIRDSDISFPVDGAAIVLCDDVLFTGRTVRAALGVLMDYGRPARISLAVLVDRGNRELPIAADYTGLTLPTTRDEHVTVLFQETDGDEGVYRMTGKETP